MTPDAAVAQSVGGSDCFEFEKTGRARLADAERLRDEGIDALVRDAVFGRDGVRQRARYMIWCAAQEMGALSSSIQDLYAVRGQGAIKQSFTVPAVNVRGPTYDVVRAGLRAARTNDVGAVVFEIARSEMSYTHQTPSEYASVVLAAAIKENWRRPVFLQGDHFQFSAKQYAEDADGVTQGIRNLITESLEAGFFNIDIDASTLVDLGQSTVQKQQALNARLTAQMTDLIRGNEPAEVAVSVGGEIGEVGKHNSTEEELRAYLNAFKRSLSQLRKQATGISKVSIQTGTSHGGVVGPDGKVVDVAVDFGTIERLTAVAREDYQLAGVVQHGASTLPDDLFHEFPKAGACEIHLATGFQNAIFDHEAFPQDLTTRMVEHLESNHAGEKKKDWTREQFVYKTRKKAFGPFKQDLWDLPEETKDAIMKTVEQRFAFLYRELKVTDTAGLVKHYIPRVRVPHPPVRP